jgi:DNA-binding IclR family transcriptional regulator
LSKQSTVALPAVPEFSFLTNHGKVLLLIAQDPRIRMRDIARLLDITERATHRIVSDLDRAGYVERRRDGRRNVYSLRTHLPLGLPMQRDIDIGSLLAVVFAQDDPSANAAA